MCERLLLLFFLAAGLFSRAQKGLPKSELLHMLQSRQNDTTLIDVYNELAWPVYSFDNHDSSVVYSQKAIELAERINDIRRLSIAHRRLGITYSNMGDFKRSIHHQHLSYELSEQIAYKKGMMLALNNLGTAYLNNELLTTALTYFLKSLKISEELKDYSIAPNLYINCGIISRKTGDHQQAKAYFRKAVAYALLLENHDMMLSGNTHLSTEHRGTNNLDSSKYYLDGAKKLLTPETANNLKFHYFLNEALLMSSRKDHKGALRSFLAMDPLVVNFSDRITLDINIAEQYAYLNDTKKSLQFYKKAYARSLQLKMFDNLEFTTMEMANIYEKEKNYPAFTQMIRQHLAFKDSNEKINQVQQIMRQQLEYDFEKKMMADSLRFKQREQLNNLELEAAEGRLIKARATRLLLISALVIVILVMMFVFSRFVVTKRQKLTIEKQKLLVEAKNEEILDSITYAKRLQTAILPQMSQVRKSLDAGILFLPKDIIGGDFYFYEEHRRRIFFAVCDCTGHGVPGAMMSVVCYEALEKAIKTFKLRNPGDILDKCREIVIDNLNAAEQGIRDGMDCTLLVIDKTSNEIHWAGANNGLWIVENGELRELKADKQPIANYESAKPFTSQTISVQPGTQLYLYTDGYADQFGGPNTKKYKSKTLKDFIVKISNDPTERQVESLHSNFLRWKRENDQVDDVAIAVIRF